MALDVLYTVRFDCECGASYAVGMREGCCGGTGGLVGLYDWPLIPATPTDAAALAECMICGRDLLHEARLVTPIDTLEIEVEATEGCDECSGTGLVSCQHCDGEGTLDDGTRCPHCDGETGLVSCEHCGGEGEVPTERDTVAAMDASLRGLRAFWDPDFSGDRVLPAKRWDELVDLAGLAVGRSSPTK